jgi:hypothetical protein
VTQGIRGGNNLFSNYIKTFVLVVVSFVPVACSAYSPGNYSAQYQGASKDWAAQLTLKAVNGDEGDKIVLSYIGPDKMSVGEVKAMFILPNGGSMGGTHQSLSPNGNCIFEGGGTGVAPPSEDAFARATIEWSGKKETFDMKAK